MKDFTMQEELVEAVVALGVAACVLNIVAVCILEITSTIAKNYGDLPIVMKQSLVYMDVNIWESICRKKKMFLFLT